MHDLKILVTGAGGFIGGWVVETLYFLGFGSNVRAGLRSWTKAPRIARFPVEIVLCDVLDEAQIQRAVENVDVVVHCAVGSKEVIIEGTKKMLAASHLAGVKRFVHLSTIDVYGEAEGDVDEKIPYGYSGNEYGESKIESEQLCTEYYRKGLPVVVLRPSIVYGPYNKLWTLKFVERLVSGNWGIFDGYGDGLCNLVYVRDLVEAILLSICSDKAAGDTFNISGDEVITWNEYFIRLNSELSLSPLKRISLGKMKFESTLIKPLKYVARFILNNYSGRVESIYQKSVLGQHLMKRTERLMKTIPSSPELAMFSKKIRCNCDKARSILRYEPKITIEEGISLSVKWIYHETLLGFQPT